MKTLLKVNDKSKPIVKNFETNFVDLENHQTKISVSFNKRVDGNTRKRINI